MNCNKSQFREWTDKFNPFNSDKYMAQVPRWKQIVEGGKIPAPATISVDPTNKCNLECVWCNAENIIDQKHKDISRETLMEIADALPTFAGGVEALCLSGGGENLLHPSSGEFLQRCYDNGIKTAIVTNGTLLDRHLEALSNCTWVGISIDAGTRETYKKLKGRDMFERVINNIEKLIKYSKKHNKLLSSSGRGLGVTYKYLLYPGNVQDVYQASRIAKRIGCKSIHIRPYGTPWFREKEHVFTEEHLEIFKQQIIQARQLENNLFRVYGITHKFDGNFDPNNDFENCHSALLAGVIMPPSGDGKFDYGFCFDRRGDPATTIKDLKSMKDFEKFWGSQEHWERYYSLPNPKSCPRCTLKPHNQIYEQMVLKDNTTFEFI